MELILQLISRVFIITTVFGSFLFSQSQLVQSFSEENIIGNSYFGRSVANGGDINNDGENDIAVGGPGYNSNTGRVQIFFGGSSIDDAVDINIDGENQNDNFGQSVSFCDFNGDGSDDLIVGASGFQSNTGKIYLFLGGNNFDLIADATLEGENLSDFFGYSVSTAGDINNDNYNDLIIGAYRFGSSTGKAYILFGGNSINGLVDVELAGENINDNFGISVSTAGDINNDNYDDVIVGASGYNSQTGRAYVFYGGSPMNNIPVLVLDGENVNDSFGISVSTAGDINNDNFDDLIIGAHGYNTATGRSYLFHGGEIPDNTVDLIFEGEGINNSFGYAVSTAGDINNDGYSDLLIGAQNYNSSIGKSYFFYGGSTMDNVADLELTGEAQSGFGSSVTNLGDVNDDGYDDVIIAAQIFNGSTGKVYILFGGSSVDNVVDLTMRGPGEENSFGSSLSSAGDVNNDGYDDIIVAGQLEAYLFLGDSPIDNVVDLKFSEEGFNGASVSTAGDVNDDGYDDIVIGTGFYNSFTGRAYIYFGGNPMDNIADVIIDDGSYSFSFFGKTVANAGDVNNDGFDDVIISRNLRTYLYLGGSPMDNFYDLDFYEFNGPTSQFGASISLAGDINSDGFDDVIIGDIGYNNDIGAAHIYFGGKPMNNIVDITISHYAINDNNFGRSVSTAGDVNNDGFDDVIIGFNGTDNKHLGRAYIYFGGNPMNTTVDVGLQVFVLNSDNKYGYSVSTAWDINHDGFDDVIVGASGYNNNTGRAYVYFGGSSMDNLTDIILDGENMGDNFGVSVSDAGDINNDGYDDVIIGANLVPLNGKAYLYSASSAPLLVVRASVKIYLEGPYNSNNMSNILDLSNTLIQPYQSLPWNYLGDETTTQSFVTNNNIVDWVFLELRTGNSASEATTVVSSRAALLRNDGVIMDTDGSEFIAFPQVNPGNYYITVYHRNHLPVISNQAVSLTP